MATEHGRILRIQGGFYFLYTDEGDRVASLPGRHKRGDFSLLPGDLVSLDRQGDDWVIASREDRKNHMDRPGVANLDDLFVVASITDPAPDFLLMDRLLAIGLYNQIDLGIIVSKVDLLEKGSSLLEEFFSYYRQTGYSIFPSPDPHSVKAIEARMPKRILALAGNSGVGKSTLLNQLLGEDMISVQGVSSRLKRGRHTTRTVTLYPFAGGYIADSPGFNVLSLPKSLEPVQLARLYPDYLPHLGECRFSNCLHDQEPGCGIRTLVESGHVSQRRYKNYLYLLQEVQEQL